MNRYAVVREIVVRKRVELDAENPIAAAEGAASILDLEDHSTTIFFDVKTTTDLIGGLS